MAKRISLTQYLVEQQREHGHIPAELRLLIEVVARACKTIAISVNKGALGEVLGSAQTENVQGEIQKKLDIISNEVLIEANEWGGHLAAMASEEMDSIHVVPNRYPQGEYLLLFDPLDGSSNIDVNVSVGSIFSVLRAAVPGQDAKPEDFLQPGTEQVCAGYAIYGPSTMLVLTLGNGTHAFTLEPSLGEWVLSHRDLKIPEKTREFAINASNSRFWEPAVKRYVDECLAGSTGPRGVDFNMRWIASLVAETHRILMRGGMFMYPRDNKDPSKPGRLRLLYEANPIGMLIEQAGGKATTGHRRILEVKPESLHQRIGFIFGSSEEVSRIEAYHLEEPQDTFKSPLFGKRGLFATTV